MDKLSRRSFVKAGAAGAVAAGALSKMAFAAAATENAAPFVWADNGTLVPDEGWHLWCDRAAEWQQDDIFLPEEVAWVGDVLCGKDVPLAVHAPTGGWGALTSQGGKEVMLPTTVEQHFWGAFGKRPYTPEEYRYAATTPPISPADDDVPKNGAYFGVSWWWRKIEIPESMRGKRIALHIRGARLRAEVYLNGKLCGYSIMEELPFEADLTHAAKPGGENVLAIRITNPFGRFDWVDGSNAKWGKLALYRSHGFAGLDRGMTLVAQPKDLAIADLTVLNTPDARTISLSVEVDSSFLLKDGAVAGLPFEISLVHATTGKALTDVMAADFVVKRDASRQQHIGKLTFASAELWDIATPNLYWLTVTANSVTGLTVSKTVPCGFRWFAPEGLGANAMFRLNGKRTRVYSSISWGFWGLNGLFPVPELAEKEVTQAKKLGLNCLNFHRNVGKEEVFRAHDRFGLMRYMEPGGGKLAIGKLPSGAQVNAAGIVMEKATKPEDVFAQKFMIAKCVAMVRAYRSHPSLVMYTLQNEIGADLNNLDTLAVLKAMRAEDPSRCIVLNDGFVAPPRKAAQAWYEPYNETIHRSDKEAWGGWWNQHQGAGDQWYDEFYKSPTDFTYKAPFANVITEFGEMEGCATPDNHALMVQQIRGAYAKYGGTSYDLVDHEEVDAATSAWLTKWGFRKAFASTEHLWNALGKKCYDTWQNYLENARISDELDFAVISGWESTAIENHSGIVDNLRNFKSDPAPIAQTLRPVHPVAKQRSTVVRLGESAVFDLFLLNDTSVPAMGTLTFSMVTPRGKKVELLSLRAPAQTADVFSYLLREGFETPKLMEEGLYRFKISISSEPLGTQTKEIWVTSTWLEQFRQTRVGISGVSAATKKQLAATGTVSLHDFVAGESYEVIISSGITAKVNGSGTEAGETTGLESVPPTMKPGHIPEPGEVATTALTGHLQSGILEAVRAGTPLLCIPQANSLSDGCARQLADAGAFRFNGNVGDFRAPWMGNWYFVREHALYAGLPVNQAMGMHYQVHGREANGLLVEGDGVEIVVGYSRDHDRKIGAGTFTAKLGAGKIVYHRVPDMHPVMQQRFLANAVRWLTERE